MQSPNKQKRTLIMFIGGGVLVLLVLALIFGHISQKSSKNTSSTGTSGTVTITYDKNSGETTRTIQGENNTYGLNNAVPIFLGADGLISNGLSTQQLSAMEADFYAYCSAQKLGTKQVSISSNITIGELNADTDSQVDTLTFNTVLDQKTTLKAILQYTGLYAVELQLFNASGTQVYDSGPINSTTQSSPDT